MTNHKITGWLLLKDLPDAKAGFVIKRPSCSDTIVMGRMYDDYSMLQHPDFFLPIHDDEELCCECKGAGISNSIILLSNPPKPAPCPTCHGQRIVKKQSPKPRCVRCDDGAGAIAALTYTTVYGDCFPTRELAEEYAAWRKEKGL